MALYFKNNDDTNNNNNEYYFIPVMTPPQVIKNNMPWSYEQILWWLSGWMLSVQQTQNKLKEWSYERVWAAEAFLL